MEKFGQDCTIDNWVIREINMESKDINGEKSWRWHLTFIGQYMQHNYYEYYVLDDIIENNPQIKSIVEIGTGHGALTTVLGLHGIKKGIPVFTVDINPNLSKPVHDIFRSLGIQSHSGNVFDNIIIDKINSVIKGQPVYIICDGGDKPREFNFWAPKIPVGSIISAHDWGVEISMNHIRDIVNKYLEPYKPERWTEMNIQFATFKKIK